MQANRPWQSLAFVAVVAAYPVLYIASANPGQAEPATVAIVTAVSVVACIVVWALLRLVARSSMAAAIATAFVVAMFYGYGQVSALQDALAIGLRLGDDATPNVLDLWPNARLYLALGWGALAAGIAMLVARSAWASRSEAGRAAMFSSLVLAAMLVVPWLLQGLQSRSTSSGPATAGAVTGKASDRQQLRDIYFIVLDGYARKDVLQSLYAFDNSPFLDSLTAAGFRVTNGVSSNYNWTFLSLASMLNMDYLQNIVQPGQLQRKNIDRAVMYDALRNNATARFLRGQGYEIVHMRSTWGATSANPSADREIRCESGAYTNEFLRAVVEASWWGAFHSKASVDLARCNLANFKAIASMRPGTRPKFVFAHFILPHHPYLFDRTGAILRNAKISNQFDLQSRLWEDRDSYREQLEFVNTKVLETVTGILANSAIPPIIVIASDHGPNLHNGLTGAGHLAIRFSSFGAYHLPDAPAGLMPESGTAVNQFRRILSHYFAADLPPLPDRHFASPFSSPYDFREVPHEKLRNWWTQLGAPPQPASPVNTNTLGGKANEPVNQQ